MTFEVHSTFDTTVHGTLGIMYYMHLLLALREFRLTRLFPGTKSRVNQGVSVLSKGTVKGF